MGPPEARQLYEAGQLFLKAAKIRAGDLGISNLAALVEEEGDCELAEMLFMVSWSTGDLSAAYRLAVNHLLGNNCAEAEMLLTRIANSKVVWLYVYVGTVHQSRGQDDRAEEMYKRAADHDEPLGHVCLGAFYEMTGRTREAEEHMPQDLTVLLQAKADFQCMPHNAARHSGKLQYVLSRIREYLHRQIASRCCSSSHREHNQLVAQHCLRHANQVRLERVERRGRQDTIPRFKKIMLELAPALGEFPHLQELTESLDELAAPSREQIFGLLERYCVPPEEPANVSNHSKCNSATRTHGRRTRGRRCGGAVPMERSPDVSKTDCGKGTTTLGTKPRSSGSFEQADATHPQAFHCISRTAASRENAMVAKRFYNQASETDLVSHTRPVVHLAYKALASKVLESLPYHLTRSPPIGTEDLWLFEYKEGDDELNDRFWTSKELQGVRQMLEDKGLDFEMNQCPEDAMNRNLCAEADDPIMRGLKLCVHPNQCSEALALLKIYKLSKKPGKPFTFFSRHVLVANSIVPSLVAALEGRKLRKPVWLGKVPIGSGLVEETQGDPAEYGFQTSYQMTLSEMWLRGPPAWRGKKSVTQSTEPDRHSEVGADVEPLNPRRLATMSWTLTHEFLLQQGLRDDR